VVDLQRNRLESGGRIDRSKPLSFKFNGKDYQGFEGDTISSALLANGISIVNRSFTSVQLTGASNIIDLEALCPPAWKKQMHC